jgi:hypothetical protein
MNRKILPSKCGKNILPPTPGEFRLQEFDEGLIRGEPLNIIR